MIRVVEAPEPPDFDATVRQRGVLAIKRLLGQPVRAPGRRPKTTYERCEDIPPRRFPALWSEPRKRDGNSTLDDMMDAYGQRCAYLAMHIERATGSPTVDHFIPKSRAWQLVYEWSNYRLSASCVNGAKGEMTVIDPFRVEPGWFVLDLDTFLVRRGDAPIEEHATIDATLTILNLRQCIAQRREYIDLFHRGEIDLALVARYAPFIAFELRRQGVDARQN